MPLSKEDLDAIKNIVEASVKASEARFEASLKASLKPFELVLAQHIAPKADELAKEVTVAVGPSSDSSNGHGLLVFPEGGGHEVPGLDEESGDRFLYLFSAAHIMVYYQKDDKIWLSWSGGNLKQEMTVKQIYLDRRYVLHGTHDIAVAKLVMSGESTTHFTKRKIKCSVGTVLGSMAVGHGLVHISGKIVLERVGASPRAMINAISVEGCSGCPLFTETGGPDGDETDGETDGSSAVRLFSFLHGCSKHRHSGPAGQRASSHLFADVLASPEHSFDFRPLSLNEKVHKALKEAEELGVEDDQDLNVTYDLRTADCLEVVKKVGNALELDYSEQHEYSVNTVMKALEGQAFRDGSMPTLWDRNFNLICAVPVPGKGHAAAVVTPGKGRDREGKTTEE